MKLSRELAWVALVSALIGCGVVFFWRHETSVPAQLPLRIEDSRDHHATNPLIYNERSGINDGAGRSSHQPPAIGRAEFENGEALAFCDDGTVTPSFFEAFSFTPEQQAYFEKQWPLTLRFLNFMEVAAIVNEVRSLSDVVIDIKPFPQSGASFRSRLMMYFSGKIPDDAYAFLEKSGIDRQSDLFAGFGVFSQHLRISITDDGWRIERDLIGTDSQGNPVTVDSIEMDFAEVPLRYKMLFER